MVVLEVTWDGDVPGLAEGRLSLREFGPAITELIQALRRIAHDAERQAVEPTASRGRLVHDAQSLDVQVSAIRANSPITIEARVLALEEPRMPLIRDLPEVAVDAFLRDIERESNGAPAHYKVRRFLQKLPQGLVRQTYISKSLDGRIRGRVEVGPMDLPPSTMAPHLVSVTGQVAAVGFEPGHYEVKVRADSGELVRFTATERQVDQALELRLARVQVLGVTEGQRQRLLRFGSAPPMDEQAREDYVFATWSELLAKLAK